MKTNFGQKLKQIINGCCYGSPLLISINCSMSLVEFILITKEALDNNYILK